MQNCVRTRIADSNDQDFLYEMLYQSIYVEPGSPVPDRKIINSPEIKKYVEDWGRLGDYALIALDDSGIKAGAVWIRYFDVRNKGYGFISSDIPELGIAVEKHRRGKGIGSFLLNEILSITIENIKSISLSVQTGNPAMKLYSRFGFYIYKEEGESVIMKYDSKT